ncbi:hypothetical protein HPP92_018644 [Vanilla planifolia]|uniref:SCP domain-containing protein n=1 Tax=Vanilla planifolia TaxID=51239 RepID=A0A835UKZ8_VANPL|nr:hypothetical protein HPP92_018644 [Vanilla planifolia]
MKSCKMPPSPLVAVPILATAILLSAAVAAGQNAPNDFIAPHNSARAAVNVGPMTWNATVAAYAEQYANYRSGSCDLVHSSGPYGENLFSGTGRDWSAADAVRAWVDEGKDYDYASNSCAAGKVCGHYTQSIPSILEHNGEDDDENDDEKKNKSKASPFSCVLLVATSHPEFLTPVDAK